MVDDEVRDGSRIGALLSSEVHGHEQGALGRLSVVDADRDATPTASGTFAYAVEYEAPRHAGGTAASDGADDFSGAGEPGGRRGHRFAVVYLHPERVRVEFSAAPETVIELAETVGLRVDATDASGRGNDDDGEDRVTPVFVETGAGVKPALRVVRAVAEALDDELGES